MRAMSQGATGGRATSLRSHIPQRTVNSAVRRATTSAAAAAAAVPVTEKPTQTQRVVQLSWAGGEGADAQEISCWLQKSPLSLVCYSTDWCGPCKLMEPELDKVSRAFPGLNVGKFNVGLPAHEDFATEQRITSLPTFRLYSGMQCLEQVTGAQPVKLRQMLTHHYVRPSLRSQLTAADS